MFKLALQLFSALMAYFELKRKSIFPQNLLKLTKEQFWGQVQGLGTETLIKSSVFSYKAAYVSVRLGSWIEPDSSEHLTGSRVMGITSARTAAKLRKDASHPTRSRQSSHPWLVLKMAGNDLGRFLTKSGAYCLSVS
jgi:hypothetical protein